MKFGNQLDTNEKKMLQNAREIVQLRKNHSALRYGDFLTLQADENIYAYLRSDTNERILVILNKNISSSKADLKFPSFYNLTMAFNLSNGEKKEIIADALSTTIEPLSFRIFSIK
jgi:glycosidase